MCGRCCSCCPLSFKKEFQLNKCGLNCTKPSCFYVPQFPIPVLFYILYKSFLVVYALSWLIYNIIEAPGSATNGGQSPFVFLTTWSYILLTLHLSISLIDTLYMTYKCAHDGQIQSILDVIGHHSDNQEKTHGLRANQEGPNENEAVPALAYPDGTRENYPMTWYHKILWIIHDMISGAAPVVTIIYFAALYPLAVQQDPAFAASALDINIHGINTVIMILDNFISAVPIRLLHVIYPAAYAGIYVIFSLIYFAIDPENNIPYPKILDWNYPEITIPVIIFTVGILMPAIQLAWYGWYKLRLFTYQNIYKQPFCDPLVL